MTIRTTVAVFSLLFATATTTVRGETESDPTPARLQQLRERASVENWTFDVGPTPMLDPDFDQGTGLKRAADWRAKANFSNAPKINPLPQRFDWREKGVVGPIRDQASPRYCGSCWAHGTTTVFESAIAIKTGVVPSISPQQLVSCQPTYGTCGGGDFAFGYYQEQGANYDVDFPYVAADAPCKQDAAQHERVAEWGFVGSENREPTTEEIKQAIYHYGPVAVTVSSSVSWRAYRSGVYNACDSQSINHIVALVGWNDQTQTWIVKNSHGTAWGEQGYMNSKYTDSQGRKCNGIGESAVWVVYEPSKSH